ncbi:hypothetical protein N8D56_23620 [Devosia sp. A8/3-2]|nr:hypothetical protein N8D56_23620 [Devosia sp. A8/3-2]
MPVSYFFISGALMAVFMQLLSALALLAATLTPALAGETPWQEVAPGVKLRLISSGLIKPDGKTLLGLEIFMPRNHQDLLARAGQKPACPPRSISPAQPA